MSNEDRISNLPDEILQSIICLIPLKSAIRTSVLSKRWRNIWQYNLISAKALDFNDEFSTDQSPKDFVANVHRYLQLYGDQKLDCFRIVFSPFDKFRTDIDSWIGIAAAKGVEELEIDMSQGIISSLDGCYLDDRMAYELPDCLLDCKILTHLSLSRCKFSDQYVFTSFSNIQSVSLNYVHITDALLENLLAGFVFLEHLSLTNCEHLEEINISGGNLRLQKLSLIRCSGLYELNISAPKLQSFFFYGKMPDYDFSNISELVDAYICLSSDEDNVYPRYMDFISQISQVKILTLCSIYLMFLVYNDNFDPGNNQIALNNLQELQFQMESMTEEHLTCIYSFFELCPVPFLEKLFIQLQLPKDCKITDDISSMVTAKQEPPDVVLGYLKFIKISNFQGTIGEMKLVKFLLQKSVALEYMLLVGPPLYDQHQTTRKNRFGSAAESKTTEKMTVKIIQGQISLIQKNSSDAQVEYCEFSDDDNSLTPKHEPLYSAYEFLSATPCHLVADPVSIEDLQFD